MAKRRAGDHAPGIEIGAVEDATGIPRETLRAWERRFGFPAPARSGSGERRYDDADVLKLREIHRLLMAGFRPNAILSLPLARLRVLGRDTTAFDDPFLALGNVVLDDILPMLRRDGAAALQERFRSTIETSGLEHFVLWCARPLAVAVGTAWCGGALQVFEEHVITEQLQRAIWSGLGALPVRRGPPLIALAALQPERHTLGLLMVNALLALAGAGCVWVGPTPISDLAGAARRFEVDVVALSFSAYFPRRRLPDSLGQLRRQLPRRTTVWAGGTGVADLDSPPTGVIRMTALEDAAAALWHPGGTRGH
jgi:hypothetical protein